MSRIVFFVSSMEGGGAERVAALLCNRWAEQGHQVLLVPTFSGRGECIYSLDERVNLEYLADHVGTTRKNLWSLGKRLLAMRQMVRRSGAESVISFLPHVNVATLLATYGLGLTVVVSERVYPPAMAVRSIWSWLRRLTYPLASRVVMQTEQGLAWLNRRWPRSRGTIIPNPCLYPLPDAQPYLAPGEVVDPNRHLLLGVGRLEDQKGFDVLLKAFESLVTRFPGWELVILGEGTRRRDLCERIESAGLSGRIHLPGRAGNLADWYNRADVYVMSSRFEGFPNTLMEAMAHGVPAVSFDCNTGPADLIQDGDNGCLVNPETGAEGLSIAITRLMSDEAARRAMGARATRVRDRFSMKRVGALWDQALGLER